LYSGSDWKSWKMPSASLRSPALESLTVYSITSWRECAGKQTLQLTYSPSHVSVHTGSNCIWCHFLLMPVFQVMQTLCYKILYCTVALACSTESSARVNFETSCVSTLQVHTQRKQHAFETMRSIGLLASSTERLSWWLMLLLFKTTWLSITACMRRSFYGFLYRILKCLNEM